MSKNCPECGKFMALSEYLPDDDEFDDELAIECGFDETVDSMFDDKWQSFHYVNDLWVCSGCDWQEWHTDGPRFYFDAERMNYFADAKPVTPKEEALLQRIFQEANGQKRLFE